MEERVNEKVAAIRVELEASYAERVRQADEQFQKRADGMKKQLSTKLSEGRESYREQIQKESEAALAQLRAEHAAEIARLRGEHQLDVETIRKNLQSGSSQPAQNSEENRAPAEPSKPAGLSALSEGEIKDFLATNPTVKGIVTRNIQIKLSQERETLIAKVKEEQESMCQGKLEEVQKKAETAKEQAVVMEGKRYSVKLSMAENKARQALAKVEIVDKASKDTPERPVAEVWAIAKDAKAAPPQQQQAVPSGQTSALPGAAGRVIPPAQAAAGQHQQQNQVQPTAGSPAPAQGNSQGFQTPAASHFGHPSLPALNHPVPPRPPFQQTPNAGGAQLETAPTQQPGHTNPKSMGGQRAVGTGPSVLRSVLGQSQSAIPRGAGNARGNNGRGGRGGQQTPTANQNQNANPQDANQRGGNQQGNPRGRGRGHGRGQQGQNVQTSNLPQTQGQNSPGGGKGMSAAAKQFVPGGQKRQREDGTEVFDGGSAGKRQRGGAGGG